MLGLLLKSFFMIGVILWYSTGVWRVINEYFRKEFNQYLKDETEKNKYIKMDRDEIENNFNEITNPTHMSIDNKENVGNQINKNGQSEDKITLLSTHNENLITNVDPTSPNDNLIKTKDTEKQHQLDRITGHVINGVNSLKFSYSDNNDEHKMNNYVVSNSHSHDQESDELNLIKYWAAQKNKKIPKDYHMDDGFCQHRPTSDDVETKCL